MKIGAEVVADSINPFGDRITSMVVTFPRFILAELNTHRMFSRNSASSRAIPFKKMVEMVTSNPFIPIAWQKDHKGMQGTEYLDEKPADYLDEMFRHDIKSRDILNGIWASQAYERPNGSALYHMIEIATELNKYGATKQIANRLLEPFMWHRVLVTSTEWENFFNLRCPEYVIPSEWNSIDDKTKFKSKRELMRHCYNMPFTEMTDLDWLKINKGQAEIHMMALAEAMYDAYHFDSKPKELTPGEWHIPFGDKIDEDKLMYLVSTYNEGDVHPGIIVDWKLRISTGMSARTSYTTVGDEREVSYETLASIHDKMLTSKPFHASPFEHPAQCMSEKDLDNYVRVENGKGEEGWCRNYRGWIQYRALIEQ